MGSKLRQGWIREGLGMTTPIKVSRMNAALTTDLRAQQSRQAEKH